MNDVQERLIDNLRTAVATTPGAWILRQDLAHALSSAGQYDEALDLFSQLAAERPDDHAVQRSLVEAYEAARLADAKLPADTAPASAAIDRAFAHLADARACHTASDLLGAEAHYTAALALQPDLLNALQNLGLLLLESRRSGEAIAIARRIMTIAPGNASAHFILGGANANLGKTETAIASYRQAIAADPEMPAAYIQLGIIMRKLGQRHEAIQCLERAVALRPRDPAAQIELGLALEQGGQNARALTHFVRAQELQPLRIVPACKAIPDFSALLLWSPGRANTPMQYLLEQAPFECRYLALALDMRAILPPIASGDVAVNLICDVDQTRDFLPVVGELVERLGRPVINHPKAVLATDRESVASLLAEIPDTRIPWVAGCKPDDLCPAKIGDALFGRTFPLLLRVAPGTHGGDDFERLDNVAEVAMFIARHPADGYYLAEYVDYRSADGYFRKYRLIFVNGEIVPYHLAIGAHWKVHHFRTAMKDHPWMQQEEEAFLAAPECVFSPRHFAALRRIQNAFGLDFFGIDCSIDRDGNLLVFEVNASMLVQPDDSKFPYKIPRNAQVKAAFQAMLAQAAARPRAA